MKKILSLLFSVLLAFSCFNLVCFADNEYVPSPEQPLDKYTMGVYESFDKQKNGYFRYDSDDSGKQGALYFEDDIKGTWKYDELTKIGTFELNNGTKGKFRFGDSDFGEQWEKPNSFRLDNGKHGEFIVDKGKDIFSANSGYIVDEDSSFFWVISGSAFGLVAIFYFFKYFKIRKSDKNVPAGYFEKMPEDMKKARSKYSFGKFRNHLLLIILALAFVLISAFFTHLYLSNSKPIVDNLSYSDVNFQGKDYSQREDVESVLIIGVDKYVGTKESGEILNNSQSDFLAIVVFDKTNKTYKILQLDRDTMVYVDILGKNSEKIDTLCQQLALAHTYGKGQQDSCYNTKKTISKLLYNVRIDNFASFTLDSVEIINKALNGVEVTIKDDFSKIDPSMKKGEKIVLTDKQALTFVEARMGVSDPTNTGRMARHIEFLEAAIKKADELYAKDSVSTDKIVQDLLPYSCSNLTADQAVRLIDTIREYEFEGFCKLDGKFKTDNNLIEFYPSSDSVKSTVIELFYEPKKR